MDNQPGPYYLAEWYRTELATDDVDGATAALQRAAAALTDAGDVVHVVSVMAAPTDDLLYALFAATTAVLVNRACVAAGMPVDRLTTRIDARILD